MRRRYVQPPRLVTPPASLVRYRNAGKPVKIGESARVIAQDAKAELKEKQDDARAILNAQCKQEIDQLISTVPPVYVNTSRGRIVNVAATQKRVDGLKGLKASHSDGTFDGPTTLKLVVEALKGTAAADGDTKNS